MSGGIFRFRFYLAGCSFSALIWQNTLMGARPVAISFDMGEKGKEKK